jgi:hypothetical protein
MAGEFRLPGPTDRTAIVGRTGSGKTVMAAFLLGEADIDRKPWIVVDYKGERIFNDIEKQEKTAITEIGVHDKIPSKPGLYVVRPIPAQDDENINELLWRVWEKGNAGVYIDEAHLLPSSDALKANLVTGRSRRIPMIVISQRPVWVPREVFSEANHHVAFDLSRLDDRKLVGEWVNSRDIGRISGFRSHWYDVNRNARFRVNPAPHPSQSVARIVAKAPRRFSWF